MRHPSEEETERIVALESLGRIVVTKRAEFHILLTNPETRCSVEYYPTRGTIVRNNVKQFRQGLDAALRLIGVRAIA